MQIREHVPLAPLCTLGVGGPARYVVDACDLDAARTAAQWARDRGLSILILGGGSNVVVADEGFPGLVLRVALRCMRLTRREGDVELTIGAGEVWDEVVARSVAEGLTGIECLSGIPGSAGATPVQNVGAYGQQVADTLLKVDTLDLCDGSLITLSHHECALGYRTSRFKTRDKGRLLIVAATLQLHEGQIHELRHAELERLLRERGSPPFSPREIRDAVLALRRRKSMILDGDDPNSRSVGSFFVNPTLAANEYQALLDAARRSALVDPGDTLPAFVLPDGSVKLSAAWLIEHAGFRRGCARGPVSLSSQHALAIVNRGGATARDVITFAREIRSAVEARFGVRLNVEPELVGVSLDD